MANYRFLVTVTDPNHPAVSKRKEKIQKKIKVSGSSPAEAEKKAKSYYTKSGYRVSEISMIEKLSEDWGEGGKSFGVQAKEWNAIQKMDQGSLIGTREEAKTRLKYLNAVLAYRKKYGQDQKKTRDKIEKLNKQLVQMKESENDPCWKGYEMVGMKDKGGKKVPNCVPTNESAPAGMEDWVKENKERFKEKYGDKWETALYATAWKIHNQKKDSEKVEEAVISAPGMNKEKLPVMIGKDGDDVEAAEEREKHDVQSTLDEDLNESMTVVKRASSEREMVNGKKYTQKYELRKDNMGNGKERWVIFGKHGDQEWTNLHVGEKKSMMDRWNKITKPKYGPKVVSEAVMSYKDWLAREKAAKAKGQVSKETKAYSKEKTKSDFNKDDPAKTPARSKKLGDPAKLKAVRDKLEKQGIKTSLKGITLYFTGNDKEGAKIRSALRHAGISLPVKKFEG